MRNGVWTKGLVMGIIMLFVGASVIPNIITNVNAKSEDKALICQNSLIKNVVIGQIVVISDGNQNHSHCSVEKWFTNNTLKVAADGEMINFIVYVEINVTGWFDLGTAELSINDNITTASYLDTYNGSLTNSRFCERGDKIAFTITAILFDLTFNPTTQTSIAVGAVTFYKSLSLFDRLFGLKLKIWNNIINEIEDQKILLQSNILCI
jgi:hypothetical protein